MKHLWKKDKLVFTAARISGGGLNGQNTPFFGGKAYFFSHKKQ